MPYRTGGKRPRKRHNRDKIPIAINIWVGVLTAESFNLGRISGDVSSMPWSQTYQGMRRRFSTAC